MKTPESHTPSKDSTNQNNWDSLTTDQTNDSYSKIIEKAPDQATKFYRTARDTETIFVKRNASLADSNEEMTEKEFKKWEDAFSDNINYAERELQKGYFDLNTIAEAREKMVFSTKESELHKTIEAQAGKYYRSRIDALREAIQQSENEEAKKDLESISDFYPAAMKHLNFKYMTPEDVRYYGYDEYEIGRKLAHDKTIMQLNIMNDLAKKYHVRPLTARNFWTSDVCRQDNQTPTAVKTIVRYDRNLVEEYYSIAFSSEIEQRERIQERQQKLSLHGY